MRWLIFAIIAWFCIGLELGFADALQIGNGTAQPSFVMILLAFVALWTTTGHVVAAALICGVVLDLVFVVPLRTGDTIVVLGPHALGCLLGSYTARTMRGLMFRRGALAVGFLAMVATFVSCVVVTACLRIRGFYEPLDIPSASSSLFAGLIASLITFGVGIPFGWLLGALRKPLGFPQTGRSAFRMP